ncbi:MAG TPA: hypothetical protein VGK74_16420 [Symbiobacteriaceae bacterium]
MLTFAVSPENRIFLEVLLMCLFGLITLVVCNWESRTAKTESVVGTMVHGD